MRDFTVARGVSYLTFEKPARTISHYHHLNDTFMYNLRTRDKILCGMNVGYRGETQRGDSEGEELEGGMEWRGEV
jgi:uncharacterized RmlC-like cupin family protein